MTAVERFLALDAWPPGWNDDYEPSLAELDARAAAVSSAWANLTDEERRAAGAPRVECAVCRRDYGRGMSPTQGANCAAQIERRGGGLHLICHYGSEGDGDVYAVRDDGTIPEADPVCDACVQKFKEIGALELVDNYLFGHPPRDGGAKE